MLDKNNKGIIIFCDGASKGNPGPGGWGAVLALAGKVYELGGAEKHTTNNRMELTGALQALTLVALKIKNENKEIITVNTDSRYVINGMTGWIFGWQKRNWKVAGNKGDDVANRDLWEKLIEVTGKIENKIKWNYVGGHIGVAGNERCDEIASDLAMNKKVILFNGKLADYDIDILNLGPSGHNRPGYQNNHPALTKVGKGKPAFSYLSLVNGILHKDKTWPECEKRVKGMKGARYQKAISADHEKEILRNFGINE